MVKGRKIKFFKVREILFYVFYFFSTGFYSGLLPFSGTMGSLTSVLIWFLFVQNTSCFFIFFLLFCFFLGIFFGCFLFNGSDEKCMVWDEFVGMWFTLLFVKKNIFLVFLSFIVFRFFDVIKPWPIKLFDRKGCFFIMLDDVVAGLFSGLIISFVSLFFIS